MSSLIFSKKKKQTHTQIRMSSATVLHSTFKNSNTYKKRYLQQKNSLQLQESWLEPPPPPPPPRPFFFSFFKSDDFFICFKPPIRLFSILKGNWYTFKGRQLFQNWLPSLIFFWKIILKFRMSFVTIFLAL